MNMLGLSAIEKYFSSREQPFKRNMLREYLQYKILEIIFNSPVGQRLAFLGGTALRIVYNNNRFSEDLDFDNFGLREEEFSALAQEVKRELELQGYEVEIKNVFKGAYRSYIRLPRVLFENGVSPLSEEKILIQIDTAPHHFEYTRELKMLNKFDVFTEIFTAPLDILLSQKIYAALNRTRTKGRDFFDVVFLLPQTKPNYAYLGQKLGIANGRELKEALLVRTAEFDFDELARDVEPFLINPVDSKRIRMFRPYVESVDFG